MATDLLPADPLLDEKEAAEFLTLRPTTLSIWRTSKRYGLEYIKVGRAVRYRRSTLVAFLESRKVAA